MKAARSSSSVWHFLTAHVVGRGILLLGFLGLLWISGVRWERVPGIDLTIVDLDTGQPIPQVLVESVYSWEGRLSYVLATPLMFEPSSVFRYRSGLVKFEDWSDGQGRVQSGMRTRFTCTWWKRFSRTQTGIWTAIHPMYVPIGWGKSKTAKSPGTLEGTIYLQQVRKYVRGGGGQGLGSSNAIEEQMLWNYSRSAPKSYWTDIIHDYFYVKGSYDYQSERGVPRTNSYQRFDSIEKEWIDAYPELREFVKLHLAHVQSSLKAART